MKDRLIAVLAAGLVLVSLLLSSAMATPPGPTPQADLDAFDVQTGLEYELTGLRLSRPGLLPQSSVSSAAPNATEGWVTVMTEDFDGLFPSTGWTVFDNDGATNGEYYWGATGCFDFGESGNRTAIPHGDGASAMYTCWQPYPTNMNSWMVYGPFDLSTATDADLSFDLYLDTEPGRDFFKWLVSTNGTDFFGYRTSGSTNDQWASVTLDLVDDPDLGDYTGEPQVWIALVFQSDGNDATHAGPWVDNVVLRKQVGDCPGAATQSYITDRDNENNSLMGSPDGDMYPAYDICIFRDNPRAPIEFNIVVPTLSSFGQAQLSLYAWDVDEQNADCPERDAVYFNGHFAGYLTGANDIWSTSVFNVDPSWVKQGKNLVQVEIDTLNCDYEGHPRWCTKVDWGQLVLGGGGGAASIRVWAPDKTCHAPGATANVQVEVDTSLASQEIRVEVNILDSANNNLVGQSQTKTIVGSADDAFVVPLAIPLSAATGDYTLQIIVYDTCSETQNDYAERTIRIDPYCDIVTPVIPDPCSVEGNKTASSPEVEAGAETQVTIMLDGLGDCPESTQRTDVMLIIDRSGSMQGTPLQDAKNAAKTFVDMLDLSPDHDRVGVVSFETAAHLSHALSSDGTSVKGAIDGLSTAGYTNIGDGIKRANQELTANGRTDAAWIAILLTDGLPNRPLGSTGSFHEPDAAYARDAAQQGQVAGIKLYTIGLGSDISHYFLDDRPATEHTYNTGDPAGHPYYQHGLAYIGAGRYYRAPTSDELEEIYQGIAGVISAEPWTNGTLVDVLSDEATYIEGSASPPLYSLSADKKTLTWKVPLIRRHETKSFTYRVRLPQTAQGYVCLNDSTQGTYNDSNGDPALINIPPACVTVVPPTQHDTAMTWKAGGWDDYAPSGIPDFDQRQHQWDYPPGSGNWSYCGPLAVANCLWWFDSKFESHPMTPPAINDTYPLLESNVYPLIWDDHEPDNLQGFVADLAYRMDTDAIRTGSPTHGMGTYVSDMRDAVVQYLAEKGLSNDYTVKLVKDPTFEWVASEVERCENVILLMGFWTQAGGSWERQGGHFVTTAGVDRLGQRIAFSDPIRDRAESGWPGRVLNGSLIPHTTGHGYHVHNDAGNVSHDIYDVVSTNSPEGTWGPAAYVETVQALGPLVGQNFPQDFPEEYRPKLRPQAYETAAVQTAVEYGLAISPAPCTVDGNKKASPDQVQASGETTVVLTVHGKADCPESTQQTDVMLIIDRSGSMGSTTMQAAKNAAKTFVDMLDLSPDRDRVGVVSYANTERLDHGLSNSGAAVKTAIDGLYASGSTNIGDGIHLANQQLEQVGRPGAAWITILLTDGQPNKPSGPGDGFYELDAEYARQRALEGRNAGIRLYTIGLGSDVSHYFLDQRPAAEHTYNTGDPAGHPYYQHGLAYIGGGRYYSTPTSAELEEIYQGIAGVIGAEPWTNGTLVDVLADNVTYIEGSASPPLYSLSADKRTLTWKVPLIRRDETKKFTYRVRLSQTAQGYVCLNTSTQGEYTDSSGQPATVDIDPACVTVRSALHDAYCQDHPRDDGEVPSNQNGEDWWISPDIWVRHQQDGVPVHENPKGGQTNHVYVRVRNRGNATLTNVEVKVYRAVGAASIAWPNDWTYINRVTIPSLEPGQIRTVSVAWTPQATGHYCFLARINATSDPVKHEGLVPFDNNLCQRNIHVLPPEDDEHDPYVPIGNPYGSPVRTDVQIDSDHYPTDGSVVVSMDPEAFDRWQESGGTVEGGQVLPGTSSISVDVSPLSEGTVNANIIGIPLGAGERTTLGLELEAAGSGEPQLSVRQMIDGEAVGGSVYRPPGQISSVYLPLVTRGN